MKFTLSWLKDHLATDASLDEIVDTLTQSGLEVEGVSNAGDTLAPFRIARVVSAERHPQADKLQVLMVDVGPDYNGGQPVQVVCGAPNAEAYMYGVFAPPGTHIPGSGITIKESAIRGVESFGMMCSARELGLGQEHDGIIALPLSPPPVQGQSYPDYAGLNDPVIDVSVLPNRPDCMGVHGIARDLAVAGLGTLIEVMAADPAPHRRLWRQAGPSAAVAPPAVATQDDDCPVFMGQRLVGCVNGESPAWLKRRLEAIGQKPISALVDVTNYITVDLGRPLHVYDAAKLTGPLVARKARKGESVLALNGKTYDLAETMTVIADDAAVHDIGGIMGGEHSGVTAATTDVVIECAYFDPDAIARTGQKLMLTSDARQRFERGVDPRLMYDGLYLATRLMRDICGGDLSEIVIDERADPYRPVPLAYDPAQCETLGGLTVAPERQRAILEALGFDFRDGEGKSVAYDAPLTTPWQVVAPSWRPDIDSAADLVEEVIRIEGIDRVPSTPLPRVPGVAKPTATPAQRLERKARRAAAARGLDEAVTWSFIPEDQAARFGGGDWTVANPISAELKVMRPSLLPGLLSAADRNLRHGAGSVRLFELGRRYFARPEGTSDERLTLGVVLAGDARPRGWQAGKAAPFDAFAAKAEALALLAAAGAPVDNLQVFVDAGPHWHPGQSATLRLGPKTVLAAFGIVHPAVAKAFDLTGPVAAVELYLDALPAKRGGGGFMRAAYTPPALPTVTRDFAFTVPTELAAGDLVRAIRGADKASIVAARAFDVFTRDGDTSMAIEVTLQPGEKAFVDAELKAIADKVVAAAAKLGATLRT